VTIADLIDLIDRQTEIRVNLENETDVELEKPIMDIDSCIEER
jgi:hypothetical protein